MTKTHPYPNWSTASIGGSPDTSPMELQALGEHLNHCRGIHGRFFQLASAIERANQQLTCRLVTTLVVAGFLLVGVGALLL